MRSILRTAPVLHTPSTLFVYLFARANLRTHSFRSLMTISDHNHIISKCAITKASIVPIQVNYSFLIGSYFPRYFVSQGKVDTLLLYQLLSMDNMVHEYPVLNYVMDAHSLRNTLVFQANATNFRCRKAPSLTAGEVLIGNCQNCSSIL